MARRFVFFSSFFSASQSLTRTCDPRLLCSSRTPSSQRSRRAILRASRRRRCHRAQPFMATCHAARQHYRQRGTSRHPEDYCDRKHKEERAAQSSGLCARHHVLDRGCLAVLNLGPACLRTRAGQGARQCLQNCKPGAIAALASAPASRVSAGCCQPNPLAWKGRLHTGVLGVARPIPLLAHPPWPPTPHGGPPATSSSKGEPAAWAYLGSPRLQLAAGSLRPHAATVAAAAGPPFCRRRQQLARTT